MKYQSYVFEYVLLSILFLTVFSVEVSTNFNFSYVNFRYIFYLFLFLQVFLSFIYLLKKNRIIFSFEEWFLLILAPIVTVIVLFYKFNVEILIGVIFIFSLILMSSSIKLINDEIRIKFISYIIYGIVFYGLAISIISLVADSPSLYRYDGILGNSNSSGRFAGFIFGVCFLAIFLGGRYKNLVILTSILTLFILIISNSRAPMLATILSLLISLRSFRQIFIITLLIAISTMAFYFIYLISDVFQFAIDSKMYRGASGRFFLWQLALDYINIYPSNYFETFSFKYDPHNNYISLSLIFGYLFAFTFYMYILILFLKSFFKKTASSKNIFNTYNKIAVYCFSWTLIYGIFETTTHITALYTGLSIYWLLSTNLMVKNKDKQIFI